MTYSTMIPNILFRVLLDILSVQDIEDAALEGL